MAEDLARNRGREGNIWPVGKRTLSALFCLQPGHSTEWAPLADTLKLRFHKQLYVNGFCNKEGDVCCEVDNKTLYSS